MSTHKRPRIRKHNEEECFGLSVFTNTCPVQVATEVTLLETKTLQVLCAERNLLQHHYEGTMLLWLRIRNYYLNCCMDELVHTLRALLYIVIKYCGPDELEDQTYGKHRTTWPAPNDPFLQSRMLCICQRLNWYFFQL